LVGGSFLMPLCPAGQGIVSQLAQGFDYLPFCFIGAFQVIPTRFHDVQDGFNPFLKRGMTGKALG
jgi:hypothetical protein